MTVKVLRRLSERGRNSTAGWIGDPGVQTFAARVRAECVLDLAALRASLISSEAVPRGISDQDLVTRLVATAYQPQGAIDLTNKEVAVLQDWKPLALDAQQAAFATYVVCLGERAIELSAESGAGVDPKYPLDVLAFLQLALALPPELWDKPPDELVTMINCGGNVMIGTQGRFVWPSDHADVCTDVVDGAKVSRIIGRRVQIRAPDAGGADRKSTRGHIHRKVILEQVMKDFPDATISDIANINQSAGRRFRELLGKNSPGTSRSAVDRDVTEILEERKTREQS